MRYMQRAIAKRRTVDCLLYKNAMSCYVKGMNSNCKKWLTAKIPEFLTYFKISQTFVKIR